MENCENLVESKKCCIEVISHIANFPEKEIIDIDKLSPKQTNEGCKRCVLSIATMLSVFGVIEFTHAEGFKIKSQTATYFMKSFVEYMKNDLTLFKQWEEDKGRFPNTNDNNVFFGVHFLNLMESKRISECTTPKIIASWENARVVIKTKLKDSKEDGYLFQFDPKSHQYKLIGGLKDPDDKSLEDTAKREMLEELPASNLKYGETFKLKIIDKFEFADVSYRFGAYGNHRAEYYSVYAMKENDLTLGQHDKWLNLSEIKNGKTKDGTDVYPLKSEFIETMSRLPLSFDDFDEKVISKCTVDKIMKIWKDPVWSKVIATPINAVIALIFGGILYWLVKYIPILNGFTLNGK